MGVPQPHVARGVLCKRGHDAWRRKKEQWRCGPCEQENVIKWRRDNPQRHESTRRNSDYLRLYGIGLEDYERMLAAQNGLCALCGNPPKKTRLAVDHDHESGAVRQLLCTPCNVGLGQLEDPVWYAKAIDYLKRHNPERDLN